MAWPRCCEVVFVSIYGWHLHWLCVALHAREYLCPNAYIPYGKRELFLPTQIYIHTNAHAPASGLHRIIKHAYIHTNRQTCIHACVLTYAHHLVIGSISCRIHSYLLLIPWFSPTVCMYMSCVYAWCIDVCQNKCMYHLCMYAWVYVQKNVCMLIRIYTCIPPYTCKCREFSEKTKVGACALCTLSPILCQTKF